MFSLKIFLTASKEASIEGNRYDIKVLFSGLGHIFNVACVTIPKVPSPPINNLSSRGPVDAPAIVLNLILLKSLLYGRTQQSYIILY